MSTKTKRPEDEENVLDQGYNYEKWNGGTGVGSQAEQLAQNVIDMNYTDWSKGTDYASLAKRYNQQGQKAMDNTIGMVAARTGGLASSYATAAGNQAYNDYMTKLEDAARALYDSQRAEAKDNYSIAQDMYDRQYGEWQDDRNFGYGMYRDDVGDAQWQENFDYQAGRDDKQDAQLAQKDAQDQVLMILSQGGEVPEELIDKTGWDAQTITAYQSYYDDIAEADATKESREADETILALINADLTWDQISKQYADVVSKSTFGEDYWQNKIGQVEQSRGFSNAQRIAQDEIETYLAAGQSNLITNDLIRQSGRSKAYWQAYEDAYMTAKEVGMEGEDVKLWTDLMMGATTDTAEVYFNTLYNISPDLAFSLFTAWGDLSEQNKAVFDKVKATWEN